MLKTRPICQCALSFKVSSRYCRFLETMRRYNYTTPKSYLEFGALYKMLLATKRVELKQNKERLENGVEKISQASAQVSIFIASIMQQVYNDDDWCCTYDDGLYRLLGYAQPTMQSQPLYDTSNKTSRPSHRLRICKLP